MKTNRFKIIILVLCTITALSVSAQVVKDIKKVAGRDVKTRLWKGKETQFIANELSVKITTTASKTEINNLLNLIHVKVIKPFNKLGWGLLGLPINEDELLIADEIMKFPFVIYAEPNLVTSTDFEPNDPYFKGTSPANYAHQWGLKNTAQTPPTGANDADIDADEAWNISTGASNIVVAVLDSGIPIGRTGNLSHEDLNNSNRIILGPDFISLENPTIKDFLGHGTHVAGIVGAEANNNLGITGVAPNSNLLIIKVFDNYGSGTAYAFKQGVEYAVNYQLNNPGKRVVINYSGGWTTSAADFEEGVIYANTYSVPIIASAGNTGISGVNWPAFYSTVYPNVVCVSSTDATDTYSAFTSHGSGVNVSAPGGFGHDLIGGINYYNGGTVVGKNIFSTTPNYGFTLQNNTDITTSYGYMAGTSMSAPFVTGIAALVLSINPNLTASQVRTIIEQSADDKGAPERDDYYGWGRVNAYQALKYTIENYGGTIAQTFTIPAGETWTLTPGITLKFASGASLIVNGTLNAGGTPSNKIYFQREGTSGSWGSIIFDGSGASNSILDNVSMSNGDNIQCLNGANVKIQNSLLDHNIEGIYVYNSAPEIRNNFINEPRDNGIHGEASGLYINVQDNFIKKTQSDNWSNYHNFEGIRFTNNTSANVVHNAVSGFWWGGYFGGGVNINFNTGPGNTNNSFQFNLTGLTSGWGSTVFAGGSDQIGGYNTLKNNSGYDGYCYMESNLEAQYNYWGGGQAYVTVDGTSTINTANFLTSDPWAGGGYAAFPIDDDLYISASTANSSRSDILTSTSKNKFADITAGILLENQGKIDDAIKHYKSMIDNDNNVNFAFTSLVHFRNKYKKKDILKDLEKLSKSSKHSALATKLLGDIYLQDNHFDDAISAYNNVISNYSKDFQGINSRFEKMFAYLHVKKDKTKAIEILSEIKSLNLTEDIWDMRIRTAEQFLGNSNTENKADNNFALQKSQTGIESNSNEYILFENYPNPFNPATVINYQLPEAGFVELKIYDLLGKEVTTLVNEHQESGRYNVTFNANNLASGVYIYRIQAGNFIASKKLILMR